MYRINGLDTLLKTNTLILVNKSSSELDFDIIGPSNKLSLIFNKFNTLMIMTDIEAGDLFNLEDLQKDDNTVIVTDLQSLDRKYKQFNGIYHKPPVLVMLNELVDDKWKYEIVSNGRIFETGIEYIRDFKYDPNDDAYKIKCVLRRAKLHICDDDDRTVLKEAYAKDRDLTTDTVINHYMNQLNKLVKVDKKLAGIITVIDENKVKGAGNNV